MSAASSGLNQVASSVLSVNIFGMKKINAQISISSITAKNNMNTSVKAYIGSYTISRNLGGGIGQTITADLASDKTSIITLEDVTRIDFILVVKTFAQEADVFARAIASVNKTVYGAVYG